MAKYVKSARSKSGPGQICKNKMWQNV